MDHAYRPARVRQMQGQNPEETGGVYGDIRRGFPKGDNPAIGGTDGALLMAEPRIKEVIEDFRGKITQ